MTIQKLPDNVIKLIAAGEVIDSFTAVVRELVENSLDANAHRIVISLFPESWSLQVVDNGDGISFCDLPLSIQPHTTSKIHSSEDLTRINTLGFRGEALHSIAQLADIILASRVKDDCGWEIEAHNGMVVSCQPKPMAIGTIVRVNQLFQNIPLRRKATPPFKQQLKSITNLIGEFALCHPQVNWQLFVNERLSFAISHSDTPKKIFPQLVKTIQFSDLQKLAKKVNLIGENNPNYLDLIIGLPDRTSRPRPDCIKIGVNGRVVKCGELESAIYQAFHRSLPKERFPVVFLHLKISPDKIDWNRHPAKAEIYLQNINFWQDIIRESIESIFKLTDNNISSKWENKRVENIIKVAENQAIYQVEKLEEKNSFGLINLTAIAQSRNTYIIAEHSQGIWLIEQHIAHERILYEKLQDNWQIKPLKNPITLHNLTEKQAENLRNIELEIDYFGYNLWTLRTIPQALENREDKEEALRELSYGGNLDTAQVTLACRTAIRNGKKLEIREMQDIIDAWKITRNPHTCPHGRPIYLSLEESSLYRFFRRHWVLGKSHGIVEKG